MHGDLGRAWPLGELAEACGMTRPAFSSSFGEVAGVPTIAYLTGWLMRLAKRALRHGKAKLGPLARSLGYVSERSFSQAFKRCGVARRGIIGRPRRGEGGWPMYFGSSPDIEPPVQPAQNG